MDKFAPVLRGMPSFFRGLVLLPWPMAFLSLFMGSFKVSVAVLPPVLNICLLSVYNNNKKVICVILLETLTGVQKPPSLPRSRLQNRVVQQSDEQVDRKGPHYRDPFYLFQFTFPGRIVEMSPVQTKKASVPLQGEITSEAGLPGSIEPPVVGTSPRRTTSPGRGATTSARRSTTATSPMANASTTSSANCRRTSSRPVTCDAGSVLYLPRARPMEQNPLSPFLAYS